MNIADMGFIPGRIMEAIVTTYNSDKSPNAAPIGIYPLSDVEIQMDVHEPSDTRSNLLRTGGCVVNVVFDPYLFLKCTILGSGKGEKENEVAKDEVIPAENVDAPVLKEANAWIELKMQSSEEKTRRDEQGEMKFSRIVCSVENTGVNKKYPIAVNRGLFAAIEAAVAKSRGMEPEERYLEIMERTLSPEEYRKIKDLIPELK
jgi:hypothetical protein